MCSTQADTYGNVDNDSEVPRIPLLNALRKKGGLLVRSDHFPAKANGTVIPAVKGAPAKVPKPTAGTLVVGDCYVDYFVSS